MDPPRYVHPSDLMRYGPGQAQTPKWDTAISGQKNGVPQKSSVGPKAQFRPPTLDEALPLSPLTSIVPFSQGMISLPLLSSSLQVAQNTYQSTRTCSLSPSSSYLSCFQ